VAVRRPLEQRARRRPRSQRAATRIARKRLDHGLTQREVSERTGIPIGTYRRYERGTIKDPGLRHLANLALLFECDVSELYEDEWLEWTVFDQRAPRPPR
jgi:transcriptional regulator with XRE-family HTH domain